MLKFFSSINNINFQRYIIILVCIEAIIEYIFGLRNAPGYADESWYYFLIHEQPLIITSYYHKYFLFAKDWDFLSLRVCSLIMMIIGGIVFSCGVYHYYKREYKLDKKDLCVLLLLGISAYPITHSLIISVPNYINFNLFLASLSIGFLMFTGNGKSELDKKKAILLIVSGVVMAQLLFVMPPNAILLLIVFFYIIYFRNLKVLMYWCIGISLGLLNFFLLIASPREILTNIIQFTQATSTETNGHDLSMLFRWSITTACLFIRFIPLSMLFFATLLLGKFDIHIYKKYSRAMLFLVFSLLILYSKAIFAVKNLPLGKIEISWFYSLFIGVVALPILFLKEKRESIYFALILMILPISLSLGTDVPFQIRGLCYIVFLIVPLWCFLKDERYEMLRYVYILLFCFSVIGGAVGFYEKKWSTGYRYIDCRYPLPNPAEGLFTTDDEILLLNLIERRVKNKEYLVDCSNRWLYNTMLNKKPLDTGFAYYKKNLPELIEMKKIKKEQIAFIFNPVSTETKNILTSEYEENIRKCLKAKLIHNERISDNCVIVTFE